MEDHRELKHAEQKIKESEQKFRNIFESANDGIVYLDILGKIIDVNKQAIQMFGGTKEELINKHFTKIGIFPTKNIQNILDNFKKATYSENFLLDLTITNKKGKHINFECSTSRIRQKGKTTGIIIIARDITEYKQAKEALKASEEKYRALVETTDTGYLILDETSKILDANQEYIRMTGRKTLKDILDRSVLEWTAPYDLKRNEQEVKKCKKQGFVKNLEIDYVDKNGGITPIEINAKVVDTEEGLRILSLCRDITERKRVDELLLISEERYGTMIEHANDMIWTLDTQGLFTFCNHQAEIISGQKLEDWKGKSFVPIIHPDYIEMVSEVFSKTLSGEPHSYTVRIYNNNGEIIILSVNTAPIYEKGKIIGTVSFGRDITESKQAEEAIQQSEEKYRSLTEHLNVGVYRNTVGAEGRFIEANPAAIEIFGYKKKNEFLRFKVADLYKNPEERKMFNDKIISEGFVRNKEIQLQKSDGTFFFGSVSAVAVKDEKGKVKYYDGIIEDITERKKTEEQLKKKNEELTAFNKLFVDRELRMIELKSEINKLLRKLGQEERFKIVK